MSYALSIPLMVPEGSITAYMEAVNRIPLLAPERERDLAHRFRETGDLDAARELVLAHLRFVVRVARGYKGYGLDQSDLIQEGNIGLMKAVKRFDPNLGVRLVSFAVHWIRAEIHEYIIRNWRIVKIATTKAQRKLFFNLRSAKQRLGWLNGAEAASIAKDLGVSTDELYRMEARLSAPDLSLDWTGANDTDHDESPGYFLEDNRFEPAGLLECIEQSANSTDRLQQALVALDDRSRDVIASRWLTEPKQTLHALAARYGISAERIRQIEANALHKLKAALGESGLAAAIE